MSISEKLGSMFSSSSDGPTWREGTRPNHQYSDGEISNIIEMALNSDLENLQRFVAQNSNSREEVVHIIHAEGRRRYKTARSEVKDLQDRLESEMHNIENIDESIARKEAQEGKNNPELEAEGVQRLDREEEKIEEFQDRFEEELEDAKEKFMTARTLFKTAKSIATEEQNIAHIQQFVKYVDRIENYNILTDLVIEEEDLEDFIDESKRILDDERISDKEPEILEEEVDKAEKEFSKASQPVKKLPEV